MTLEPPNVTLQQPSLLMRVALVLAVVAGWTFSSRDAPMAAQTNLERTPLGAAATGALPISVEIVPTSSDPATGNAIALSGLTSHFRVVVTNHSSAPIKVWDGWCSWGYSNLSFQARDSAGRRFVISKMPSGWLKNYPCPRVIDPGSPWIINVDLDPSIWQSSPVVSSESGQATLQLKAVFEIVEDEDSKRDGVWTGKVSSPEAEYTISWLGDADREALRRGSNPRLPYAMRQARTSRVVILVTSGLAAILAYVAYVGYRRSRRR